jgi:hypothetical protein
MHSNLTGKQDIQVKITFLGKANVRYIEGVNAVGIELSRSLFTR